MVKRGVRGLETLKSKEELRKVGTGGLAYLMRRLTQTMRTTLKELRGFSTEKGENVLSTLHEEQGTRQVFSPITPWGPKKE